MFVYQIVHLNQIVGKHSPAILTDLLYMVVSHTHTLTHIHTHTNKPMADRHIDKQSYTNPQLY